MNANKTNIEMSEIIKNLVKDCSVVDMTIEAIETLLNSSDSILILIEEDAGLIRYLRNASKNSIFQNIPTTLQDELINAIGFISEAEREARFLQNGRKIKIDHMICRPDRVTPEFVKEIYKIGLVKYILFVQYYFANIISEDANIMNSLPAEVKEDIENALCCIRDFEELDTIAREYLNTNVNDYLGIRIEVDDGTGEYDDEGADTSVEPFNQEIVDEDFDIL